MREYYARIGPRAQALGQGNVEKAGYTTAQAARKFEVTRALLRYLVVTERINAWKDGNGCWRFDKNFVDSHRSEMFRGMNKVWVWRFVQREPSNGERRSDYDLD